MTPERNAPASAGTEGEGNNRSAPQSTVSVDRLQVRISVFGNAYATKPEGDMTVAELIEEIRCATGEPHAMLVAEIRAALEDFRNKDADKLKKSLPAVTLSGRVTKGTRSKAMAEGRFEHSGFLQIDLDGKDFYPRTPEEVRDQIGTDPHVVAAFLSPSGTGAKAIMRIPQCATEEEHKLAFAAAEKYFLARYALKIDTSCKDPARLCFLSHDPASVAAAGEVDELVVGKADADREDADLPRPPRSPATPPSVSAPIILGDGRDEITLADLSAMIRAMPRPGYDSWLKFINGAWQHFGPAATSVLVAGWPEEEPGEYDKKFQARFTDGTVTIGTCIHLATTEGTYRPPIHARMASLHVDREDAERIHESVAGGRFLQALADDHRGLAQAYADIRFSRRCYVHDEKIWRKYAGGIWERDDTASTLDDLQVALTPLLVESANERIRKLDSKDHRSEIDALRKKSKSLYNLRTARAVLENAEALREFAATRGQFDQHPHLLVIENGVVDFDTCAVRDHRPGDMATMLAPITYDPKATCPHFDTFLEDVTQGDVELADFLLESTAIALTGNTDYDFAWFHYGGGGNGKSTLTQTIRELAGPICTTFDSALLVGSRESSSDDYKRASLEGRRLAIGDELPDGRKLRTEELKKLIGGDTITARNPYEKPRDFRPTHKTWLVGNHKPLVDAMDHGLWRRLLLVPWDARFDGGGPSRSERVAQHVREGSGILNRLLAAWQRLRERGTLVIPAAVAAASSEYKQSSDQVAQFAAACIRPMPGTDVALKHFRVAYDLWCESEGEKPTVQSNRKLGSELRRLGFKTGETGGTARVLDSIVRE